MSEHQPSRRALLRYASAGAVASLAGCLWGDGDDNPNGDENDDENGSENGDENGSENGDENGNENGGEEPNYGEVFDLAGDGAASFRNWLIPDNPLNLGEETTSICGYQDFGEAVDREIEQMQSYRRDLARGYGIEPDALTGELLVGAPEGTGRRQIHLGSFDREAIVDTLSQSDEISFVDEYRGYSIFEDGRGNRGAVGSDAILSTNNYEEYIDASNGDADRLIDVDEDARHLLEVLPAGIQIGVSRHGNLDDLSINGSSYHTLDEDGNPARTTRAFVFNQEGDATVERAREIISIGDTGYEEIITEEQHGRMVMIEYVVEWSGTQSDQ